MKRLLCCAGFLGLLCAPLRAQQPQPVLPDCIINFNFTTGGSTPVVSSANCSQGDNRFTGADTWTIQYTAQGFSAFTLTFQSATGPVTAGAFGTYTGDVVTGTNPLTALTEGAATFSNLLATPPVATPWVRVNLSGVSGTGQITGVLYGYRTGYSSGNGGGGGTGGCVGTTGTPCIVAGPAAAGAAPSGGPVEVGGTDGTDVRLLKTDANGNQAIFQIGLGTFTAGQQAVTGTAAALASNAAKSVCVKALIANTINVYVGATGVTTSTGFELTPGGGACWNVANSNQLFVVASTTGASVSWSLTN